MTLAEVSLPSHDDERKRRRAGRFWALAPVGILGVALVGLGTLIAIAVDDAGFAVERDYYQKAVRFDDERAQLARNAELGWRPALEVTAQGAHSARLLLQLRDANDNPLAGAKVSALAFHNARAGHVLEIELEEVEPGAYSALAELARPGLWEIRLTATRDSVRFTSPHRVELRTESRQR